MPESVFGRLAAVPEGQLLLVNMYLGLVDDHSSGYSRNDVLNFFAFIAKQVRSKRTSDASRFLHEVHAAVWNPRAKLQLRGSPSDHTGDFLVFRCLSSMKRLLGCRGAPSALRKLAAKWSKGSEDFTDDDGEELAENINRGATHTPFYLSILVPKRRRVAPDHRCIVWYSRRDDWKTKGLCPWDGGTQGESYASSVRNWLGLGDWEPATPVFAFCSIGSSTDAMLRRPTVFDAIDQRWFKYRRNPALPLSDTWARATDLEKIAKSDETDLDGGPEAVGESQPISNRFRCYYVGMTDGSTSPHTQTYLGRLAAPDAPIDLMRRLHKELWPKSKCTI